MADEKSGNKVPWIIGWAVSVVVAFLLGTQSASLGPKTAAPSAQQTSHSQPAEGSTPGTEQQSPPAGAEQLPKPMDDPKLVKVLQDLPRKKADDITANGKVDAPVTMIMWSDYRCPFCSLFTRDTLPKLQHFIDDGTLRVEFRDMPLFGEQSEAAAYAGRAAAMQGKFWQFHDVVAKHAPTSGHPNLDDATLLKFAQEAGVTNTDKFNADRTSGAVKQAVAADTKQARELGLSGTPFFVVNTTPISGAQPLEVFTGVIEREAKR